MRPWYAALIAGLASLLLACATARNTANAATPETPTGLGAPAAPLAPVALPTTLSRVSRVCRWAESTGNPPPPGSATPATTASLRHKHISIVNWKLIEDQTWLQMFPRKGSSVRFNPELSYGRIVDPAAVYNDLELLDFRAVNPDRPPADLKLDIKKDQLCAEAAPDSVGEYYTGPLMFSISPLQNAVVTDISEHVVVYAPIHMLLEDGEFDWWVLLIWHVRSAGECALLPEGPDRESCLALLELADLDPARYAERVPQLLARVKYPYQRSATHSHNGIIHGVIE